jgi:2'-5' RNA ligase
MPRLFTALEIPTEIAARLVMLKGKLNGARWIDRENYHLTLRFAGDIDDNTAKAFATELENIQFDGFELSLGELGSFGGNKPRSLWAGIRNSEALQQLQKLHERAARAVGLPPETRGFTPHVTLARLRDTRPQNLAEYLSYFGGFTTEPFRVERFVLFSARANSGGGPYLIEKTYPFEEENVCGDEE